MVVPPNLDLKGRLEVATLECQARNPNDAIGYVLNSGANSSVYVINGGQYVGKNCLVKFGNSPPHNLKYSNLVNFISSELPENFRGLSIDDYFLTGQFPHSHESFPTIQEIYRYFQPGSLHSVNYLKTASSQGLGRAVIRDNHIFYNHDTINRIIKYSSKIRRGIIKVIITEPDAAQLEKITNAIKQAGLTPIIMEPLGARQTALHTELTIPQ